MKFVKRVVNLLICPKKEWELINIEDKTFSQIFKSFLIYIIIFQFIDVFINNMMNDFHGVKRKLGLTIIGCIFFIFYIQLIAEILNSFAKKFGLDKDLKKTKTITSYCSIFLLLLNIMQYIPHSPIAIGCRILALIYVFYLRYLGLKIVMGSKKHTVLYTLLPELIFLVIVLILYAVGLLLPKLFIFLTT